MSAHSRPAARSPAAATDAPRPVLRIGVDARALCQPLAGLGRYTQTLLTAMCGSRHHFFLYAPGRLASDAIGFEHVRVRSAQLASRAARMAWAQTLLPAWCSVDRLDVFWSPVQRLPLIRPPRLPTVVTVHDLVWLLHPHTMRPSARRHDRLLVPQAIRAADLVVSVSRHTATELVRVFPEVRPKLQVIYPQVGSLPTQHAAASAGAFGLTGPYVLFVGTLEPRKNLERLLAAFAMLPEALRSSHRLVIAGAPGWGCEGLPRQLAALGERVRVLGRVSDLELNALLRGATVLAYPSLYEGFGLPLLEAMAHGTAILSSTTGAIPEVVGDAAVLVDPTDVRAIALGLERLLTDAGLRERCIARGRARLQHFHAGQAAARMLACFEALHASRQACARAG